MIAFVCVLLLLIALGGFSLSVALVRHRLMAVCLAPVVSAVLLGLAATLATAARLSLVPCAALVIAVAVLGGQRLRKWIGHGPPRLSSLQLALCVMPPAVALALLAQPAVGFDPHSFWWFKAEWLWQGGATTADHLGDPAYNWAHADYPPFSSASVAMVWTAFSGEDQEVAQLTAGLLTWSALSFLAIVMTAVMPAELRTRGAMAAGALGLTAVGLAGEDAMNGYNDLLWATLFGVSAVLLLVVPANRWCLALGVVALAGCATAKAEGMAAGTGLLLMIARRWRRGPRWIAAAIALLPGVAWQLVARIHGAASDLQQSTSIGGTGIRDHLSGTERALVVIRAVAGQLWPILIVTGALALGACILLGRRQWRRRAADARWLVSAGLVYLAFLAVVYTWLSNEVVNHLRSSVNRTTIAVQVMFLLAALQWLPDALRQSERGVELDRSGD